MSPWAITAYFNPRCFRARLNNYRRFRHHLALPLLTIEWATDGAFQLGDHKARRWLTAGPGAASPVISCGKKKEANERP